MPSSQIGCLIGKGGAKISEMRRITKANIRILSKEDVPKVAEKDDEMVQVNIFIYMYRNIDIVHRCPNNAIGYRVVRLLRNLILLRMHLYK